MPTLDEIRARLYEIEQKEGIHIIFSVESGSRSWGFHSPDSDFDIRFIYHYPKTRYLQIDPPKEQITLMDGDGDFVGWDIYKAAKLLRGSNPTIIEWLFSPHIYLEEVAYAMELRQVAKGMYNPIALEHHYRSMAKNNWYKYILDENDPISKKYLYVVNPLLSLMFLMKYNKIPPLDIDKRLSALSSDISPDVYLSITSLIHQKRSGSELGRGKPNTILSDWCIDKMTSPVVGHDKPYSRDLVPVTRRLNEIIENILSV